VVTFHAESVHDFVWTTSPDYLYETGQWNNIPIHILYQKSSRQKWNKQALNAAKQAIAWLEQKIGEFPYPQLTISQGLTDGGMEYPMMTVLGYYDFILTFHEITHMYFYGALANNEHKNGWLDEGLVTYLSELYEQEKFGKKETKLTPSLRIKDLQNQFKPFSNYSDVKLNSLYYYFYSGFEKPLATECYLLKNPYLYSYNVYVKPTKFFSVLNYIVGREKFIKILQTYYQNWKFKHVDLSSLQNVCEKISVQKLDWFFNHWVKGTPRVDYACSKIVRQKQKKNLWKTDVFVKRLGDGVLPVEVEAITASSDTLMKKWDGKQDQTTLTFITDSKIKKIQLDPRDIILDQNRFNNGTPRFKMFLYPEFPSMYYMPRDSYSLFFWPRMWYNDIDGVKLGLNILGSYLNRYYVTRTYLWYNLESQRFDFNFGYSMPWGKIHKNLWRHFYIKKMDGRFALNANIQYNVINVFAQQPTHNFRFGYLHYQLTKKNYNYRKIKLNSEIINVQDWEKGSLNKFYFQYILNHHLRMPYSIFECNCSISNRALGSDFDFSKFSLFYNYETIKFPQNFRIKFRGFWGYASTKKKIPIQDQFWIAEGSPIQRFNYYYLRSPGSMPTWINYFFPGDGNLRGYFNKLIPGNLPLAGNKLITTNLEIFHRKFHALLPMSIRKLVMGIDFTLFVDAGRIWLPEVKEKYLFDAGFGLLFYKLILGKQRCLRLNFPIWLSQPNLDLASPNESNWKFRWIVSFQ